MPLDPLEGAGWCEASHSVPHGGVITFGELPDEALAVGETPVMARSSISAGEPPWSVLSLTAVNRRTMRVPGEEVLVGWGGVCCFHVPSA